MSETRKDALPCAKCGHAEALHYVNGKHPEIQPCWHKDGELYCGCEQFALAAVDGDAVREARREVLDARDAALRDISLAAVSRLDAAWDAYDALLSRSRPEAAPGGKTAEALTLASFRKVLESDSYAASFQSLGQYRSALILNLDSLAETSYGESD